MAPKHVFLYLNSDNRTPAKKVIAHAWDMQTLENFYDFCTLHIAANFGAVRKVYTMKGVRIKNVNQIQSSGKYICCGPEKFKHVKRRSERSIERASPRKETSSVMSDIEKTARRGAQIGDIVKRDETITKEKAVREDKKLDALPKVRDRLEPISVQILHQNNETQVLLDFLDLADMTKTLESINFKIQPEVVQKILDSDDDEILHPSELTFGASYRCM